MLRCTVRFAAGLFFAGVLCRAQVPGVWLDVPFVAQKDNMCGAATLAMVLQYWEREQGKRLGSDVNQIERLLYSPQARGIFASDMEGYLQQQGLLTFQFRGNWVDLQQHLQKGRPLIVALSNGHRDLHYVVVAGLDSTEDVILKNDPAERKLLKQNRTSFEQQWKAAGNWTLLAVPQQSDRSSQ